jgi:hypothetical protein
MHAGLYVASPVEDYFLLCHTGSEGDGGLTNAEQQLVQRITREAPLLPCPALI